jgi:hypothetical protein
MTNHRQEGQEAKESGVINYNEPQPLFATKEEIDRLLVNSPYGTTRWEVVLAIEEIKFFYHLFGHIPARFERCSASRRMRRE